MVAMASSTSPRFQCILTSDPEKFPENDAPLWFDQEKGKKSSFLLQLDNHANQIAKPAHVILKGSHKDVFLFGGLEIITNARNIEIYLTGEDGKETYLTTSRGLLVAGDDDPYRFKCLVVCPGGPRPVTRVHLKLLSLKPASCTGATLHLVKLKGRLPPPKQQQETNENDGAKSAANADNNKSPAPAASPGITQADMSNAVVGVSLLVRSVETSLLQSVQASLDRLERKFDARFDRIEQYMVMQQQQALVQQQQQHEQYTEMNNQIMTQMKEQQSEMVALMGSLHAQLAIQGDRRDETNDVDVETHAAELTTSRAEVGNLEALEQERSEPSGKESIEAEKFAATATTEPPQQQASDIDTCDAATEEVPVVTEVVTKQEDSDQNSEERIQSEMKREGRAEEEPQAAVEDAVESEQVKEENTADEADTDGDVEMELSKCNSEEGNDDGARISQSDSEPRDETETPLVETSGGNTDGKVGERTAETEEQESKCVSDKGSESATDFPAPEVRPVMNQRDDAIEIPDLLSDVPNSGMSSGGDPLQGNQVANRALDGTT